MKLKTNNKFSKWLFKLAYKFGYNPLFPKPNTVYITPKNFIKLSYVMNIPKVNYTGAIKEYVNQVICHKLIEQEVFKQNVKFTSRYDPINYTETIYAELYILNKEGLEDFYERY